MCHLAVRFQTAHTIFHYSTLRDWDDIIKVKYVGIQVPAFFNHTILSIACVKYMLSLPSMCNVPLLLSILHIKSSLQVLKNGSCSKIFAVFYENPFYRVHTMYFSHPLNCFARKFFNVIKELAAFNNIMPVVSHFYLCSPLFLSESTQAPPF